jgi:dihydrofolate reductase
MKISLIVAVAEGGVIGHKGGLPWHLSADLRYFKRTTMGHPLVMGRKTWDSIGRPLPGRENIVITRRPDFAPAGVHVCHDLDPAVALAEGFAQRDRVDEIMVIGGAQIFDAVLPRADRIYLTEIHATFPGDVFFAAPDLARWRETSRSERHTDERSGLDYTYVVYDRQETDG